MKDKVYDFYLKICFLLIIIFIASSAMMLVALPPFQGPDEEMHWATVIQKAMFSKEVQKCSKPAALPYHLEMMKLPHHAKIKVSTGNYEKRDIKEDCDFVIGNYPSLAYLGFHFAKLFVKGWEKTTNLTVNVFYLSRMFSLFFIIISILGFYALLRKHRENCTIGFLSFLILALSPIFIQQSVIVTADNIVNIYAILLVICFLFWGKLNWITTSCFLIVGGIVAFTKPVFLPASIALVISQILISKTPIQNFKKVIKRPEVLVIIGVILQVVFTYIVSQSVTVLDTNPKAVRILGSEPVAQIEFMLENPWEATKIINNQILKFKFKSLSNGLGWLDTRIAKNIFWVHMFYSALIIDFIFAIFICISRRKYFIKNIYEALKNIFMIVTSYGIIAISVVALYVRWTAVSANHVTGVQARYYIPFLTVLIFSLFDLISLGRFVPVSESTENRGKSVYIKYLIYTIIIFTFMYFSSTWIVDIVRRYY